ncbi:hypothetical protein VTJ49DRAFT_4495 [Mycothermus thermophilus]|uniref:Uncharacterized protein n=1 Tax=Humicola insolens TaxID=85995 RepID=A0ABR3V597_HUMIN
MPRCSLFRFRSRCAREGDGARSEGDHDLDNIDEKQQQTRCPRDWSAIWLTVLRLLQFSYFAFAYCALRSARRSGLLHHGHDHGHAPWQNQPDGIQHNGRLMHWAKTQFSVTLIYHAAVLVVPCLLRLVRAKRQPVAGLGTLFGDGVAMMAMLNTLVMLDSVHEGECHSFTANSEFDLRQVFKFAKGGEQGDAASRRDVCRSLDVIFALGGLVMFVETLPVLPGDVADPAFSMSYFVTAAVTAWRAKRSSLTGCHKAEPASDIEQGVVRHSDLSEPLPTPPTPRGRHSPPPPYHPVVSEMAQGRPSFERRPSYDRPPPTPMTRSRASTETMSSLGYERYLVSDGWRAPERPPEYSSRPPSLHHAVL